ncbi:1,4-dihydroxy-2-naphthoate octaprenyltransferase [Aquirufa antheringensis]|uniref:1,4-dihydroxy-2-naphthoate octaprenyltransferase n=1 Tax=Aquirufa antheringensis TaxID=2516559 RepID=UPI001032F8C4|nr:1,4-dihydroxy-2-naphthoate octaprenyltransferase [Aquirufa antheringensis]TBH70607.1 1,4-dihydroxy-2-naphthoate octaprenyltransferase [Aquirufa antheringensis]
MNRWVDAARPRTLPLAVGSILLGNFLAFASGKFDFLIALLATLTTLLLQILSNFANDLGDYSNGVDNADRKVALRAVQTGKISQQEMRTAVIGTAVLSFVSGISLLFFGLKNATLEVWGTFLGLGVAAIAAAIAYTVGKRPYGYMGLGDISVFLFFGLIGTLGTFYLQTYHLDVAIFLPASGCGLLSVAVLNLNNLRDIDNDIKTGKNSIPVRIGKTFGFYYQKALYIAAIACFYAYPFVAGIKIGVNQQLLIVGIYPIIGLFRELHSGMNSEQIDPYLKKTALRTLFLIIVFGIIQILTSQ